MKIWLLFVFLHFFLKPQDIGREIGKRAEKTVYDFYILFLSKKYDQNPTDWLQFMPFGYIFPL